MDIIEAEEASHLTPTSLGLGDTTPPRPIACSLVVLEALFGQLSPAIPLARLLAIEPTYRQRRREAREGRND